MMDIKDRLTVIITTSPSVVHPSHHMLEEVLRSFELVEGLARCRKLIVCDGYKVQEDPKHKNYNRVGVVKPEQVARYQSYMDNVEALTSNTDSPFYQAKMLRLAERNGFGFAVKNALASVETEFVMVVQHDRNFISGFDLMGVLEIFDSCSDVMFMALPTSSVTPGYKGKMTGRFGLRIEERRAPNGMPYIPMLVWLDSTHIARSAYYRDFVFGPRDLVAKGGFIEDKFGQAQAKDLRERGLASHAEYGTFLLGDGDWPRIVAHLDGHDALNNSKFIRVVDDNKGRDPN